VVLRLGIGIVTYNRRSVLAETVDRVRRLTRHSQVDWVVADDSSSDDTAAWLRAQNVPMITGVNMGVTWNKNRALYLLSAVLNNDVVILLEDDTQPTKPGWEQAWIEGAQRWGHINYARPWTPEEFLSGKGTPAEPIISKTLTAQIASFSREALLFGGYFDSRFKGFGHGHVEHSRRLIRVGFGGTDHVVDGREQVLFHLIHGDVETADAGSFFDPAQAERNLAVAKDLMVDQTYRPPWQNDRELRQFRAELASAIQRQGEAGISLRGGAATAAGRGPGLLHRLFGGARRGQ
jgi:glycosyltransferase involved in cell wall biosynthesis